MIKDIHPQYVLGIVDSNLSNFKIQIFKEHFIFKFELISYDISIISKIKKRFQSGKIIQIDNFYVLKISNQIENVISFFEKNKILNKKQRINFIRFRYLFLKLNKKSIELSKKEEQKIKKRLQYFL